MSGSSSAPSDERAALAGGSHWIVGARAARDSSSGEIIDATCAVENRGLVVPCCAVVEMSRGDMALNDCA